MKDFIELFKVVRATKDKVTKVVVLVFTLSYGFYWLNNYMDLNQKEIMNSLSQTTLVGQDIDYIARMAVAKQSITKIAEIKSLMKICKARGCNINNPKDVKRFKLKVKEILVRNSLIYVKALNRYRHHELGNVGDYIWENFPMNSFLEEVYAILLVTEDTIDDRCIYLMDYMVDDAQASFFEDMYKTMKGD